MFTSLKNSRFDILNKEPTTKKEKELKKEKQPLQEEKKKSNNFIKSISSSTIVLDDLSSFPELMVTNKKEEKIMKNAQISFTDIVQLQKEEEIIETLPEGWIELKKGKNYKEQEQEQEQEQEIDPSIVFKKIVEFYEKRKINYIENWGIDEYEKEFQFPNYCYETDDYDEYDEVEFEMKDLYYYSD